MSKVRLTSQGQINGPRILNGMTIEGKVNLVADSSLSGTVWEMRTVGNDGHGHPVVVLRCEGNSVAGKDDRFLDGRTADGTVGLAPDTAPPFSGTQWSFIQDTPPFVKFKCQGTGTGSKKFLDGRTANGTVGLIVDANPQFSGSLWGIETL